MENENTKTVATVPLKDVISFKSMDDLRKWGDEMAATGFTPLTKGKDIVAAVITGQELGLKPMFSANNIYPINGRATLGIHAMAKLLLEAGILVEVLKDYAPCVNFVMRGDDINGMIVPVCLDKNNKEVPYDVVNKKIPQDCKPIIIREGFVDEVSGDYEIKGKRITNYKTVIKFTRKLRQPDGTFEKMTVISSYSYNEAASVIINKAGDTLINKDNWANWTPQMVYTRAYTFGAKRIGDDILGGLPETTEYADFKGIEYTMNESKVTIIDSNPKDSISTENLENATLDSEEKDELPSDDNKSSNI
jgi:hypothetical protein